MEMYTSRSASICVLLCFRKMSTQLDLEADAEEFEASPEYIAYPSFNMSCLETIQSTVLTFLSTLSPQYNSSSALSFQPMACSSYTRLVLYVSRNGSSYGISQHTILPCNSFVVFNIKKIFIIYYFSIFLLGEDWAVSK